MMWKYHETGWLIFILGLLLSTNRCESRAVNISNTWTLPQDGFTVFYRFFRDKISWFEADAVCQFHHANLVTVDNGQQFDAAREFLKILDVTEPVWIGLMRPQNSERFAWSNSKPLASTSGYWAESLPLIESPLCAVIDPVRDFRWHALRCGGPETASFLCEMNVPSWASECIIKGISSLTIQYMADSGSVELTKDCDDDSVIHQICKGKQDRERILKELTCKNEKNVMISENSIAPTDLAETHQKALQIISNIPSHNNEDNNISVQRKPQNSEDVKKAIEEDKNPVQKLIEQFNVEELMQADQPQEQYQEIIPKPVKKTLKKATAFEKKYKSVKKLKASKIKSKPISQEEMMMGDQPIPDVTKVQEPLPHIKKSLPQDLKHQETTTIPELISTTEQESSTFTSEVKHSQDIETTTIVLLTDTTEITPSPSVLTTLPAIEPKTGTIGHPMHPQQQRVTSSIPTEDSLHSMPHIKETNDNHFIPPMLLVKSHYTSTKPHLEEQGAGNPSEKLEITTQNADLTTTKTIDTTSDLTGHSTNGHSILSGINGTSSIIENNEPNHKTKLSEKISSTTFEPPSTEHQIVEIKIGNSDNPTTFSITTRPAVLSETTSTHSNQNNEHNINNNNKMNMKSIDEINKHELIKNEFPLNINHHDSTSEQIDSKENHSKEKNKFSNEENYQPYKPNRRRSLTKPEATTYLKKILG